MMKRFLTLAMTGIFVLSLQGPIRAQREVAPPPIPPLLEGQRPLDHVETKQPAPPQKVGQKKSKDKGKVKSRVKAKAKSRAKSRNSKRKAKVKKLAGKKPQAVAKKKSRKASKKKRPAVTRRQAGPDEG